LEAQVTPASWLRETLKNMGDIPRDAALRELVEQYLVKISTGQSVTEW
jgi:hypothetical protein